MTTLGGRLLIRSVPHHDGDPPVEAVEHEALRDGGPVQAVPGGTQKNSR
jgi:hypothetical protein